MDFEDPFHESKANARTFAFGVQLAEETEDTLVIFGVDAHAVVVDKEDGISIPFSALSDLDDGIGLIPHIFRGIVEQVL